jgi:hypothetical protein
MFWVIATLSVIYGIGLAATGPLAFIATVNGLNAFVGLLWTIFWPIGWPILWFWPKG